MIAGILAATIVMAPGEPPEPAEDPELSVAEKYANAIETTAKSGDIQGAIDIAIEAYAETNQRFFLYAQATLESKRGHCSAALPLYAKVLAQDPTGQTAEKAKLGYDECEGREDTYVPPPPVEEELPEPAPPPPVIVEPEPEPEPAESAPSPFRDVTGGVLLGVGVAALATGGGLLSAYAVYDRRANAATDEASLAEAVADRNRLLLPGVITAGVGVALLSGAFIRYALVKREGTPTATASVTARSVGVSIRGRF